MCGELLPAESMKPLTFRDIKNTGTINSSFQSASVLIIILHIVGPLNERFKTQCLTSRAFLFLYAEQFWYCLGSHLLDLNLDETKLATGITYADEWCSKQGLYFTLALRRLFKAVEAWEWLRFIAVCCWLSSSSAVKSVSVQVNRFQQGRWWKKRHQGFRANSACYARSASWTLMLLFLGAIYLPVMFHMWLWE